MRAHGRRASIGLVVAALSGVTGSAAASDRVALGVAIVVDDVDDRGAPAARRLAAMIAEADAIWRPYGVTVVLAREVAPGDLPLALVFGPLTDRAQRSGGLGSIWFDEYGTPGQTITVDDVAVRAMVGQTRVNGLALEAWPPALAAQIAARALGRVLAHEIGHYLLASPAHTRGGVMRATFNGRHLADGDRRNFSLDQQALPRLRLRLARLQSSRQPSLATLQPVP